MKMEKYKTTIRKGIVRYWSCYEQQWLTFPAGNISDRDLSTLTQGERNRIAKAARNDNDTE